VVVDVDVDVDVVVVVMFGWDDLRVAWRRTGEGP